MFKVVEEILAYARAADDALGMEVVVGAELERPVLFDLNMDDVLHEATIWEDHVQDGADVFWFQGENHEVLLGYEGLSTEGRCFERVWVEVRGEDASGKIAFKRDMRVARQGAHHGN